MKTDRTQTADRNGKREKRIRFAGLVILTVAVIAAVLITMFAVRSCNEKVYLDIGQSYDVGKASVTVTDVYIERMAKTELVYAVVTVKVEAEKDFTLDTDDFRLDDVPAMTLSLSSVGTVSTGKTEVAAGETKDVKVAFCVPRSMKVSDLTYKKAVIRLGSMIENDNNLS